MLSPHLLLLSIALTFLGGTFFTPSTTTTTTLAAHTYRGAAIHAATGEAVVIARSPHALPQQQGHEYDEDLSKRTTEFALTLPRFDVGHGHGDGEEASRMMMTKKKGLAKRDALDANAALFAPTAMVKVGGKEHKMLIVPSYPQTVFTPEAAYTGGTKTPFKDTLKQQDGSIVTDTIYLDSVAFGGATALNVSIGSSSAPIPTLTTGSSIHTFGADGVLGFMPDSNPAGYPARVSKTLKGFASSLPEGGQVLTIRLNEGLSSGGVATIGRPAKQPKFSFKTAYSDQWAASGVKINGQPITSKDVPAATVDTGSPFCYAPLPIVDRLFRRAGITKTRTTPWRGSTVLEGLVDCGKGFPISIDFATAGTVVVPAHSGVYMYPKDGVCVAALRGSPEGDAIVGWPLFRGASVSYDAKEMVVGVSPGRGVERGEEVRVEN